MDSIGWDSEELWFEPCVISGIAVGVASWPLVWLAWLWVVSIIGILVPSCVILLPWSPPWVISGMLVGMWLLWLFPWQSVEKCFKMVSVSRDFYSYVVSESKYDVAIIHIIIFCSKTTDFIKTKNTPKSQNIYKLFFWINERFSIYKFWVNCFLISKKLSNK